MKRTEENPLLEQLSQLMDGELPADQARFLLKRMEHDDQLCARYERWQLISTCIQRRPMMRLPDDFSNRIQSALGEVAVRRGLSHRAWFSALAVAALMMVVVLPLQVSSPTMPDRNTDLSARLAELRSDALLVGSSVSPSSELADVPNRPWPRSQVPVQLQLDANAFEAYMVRHNEFVQSNGLATFMPYVDVISAQSNSEPVRQARSNPR